MQTSLRLISIIIAGFLLFGEAGAQTSTWWYPFGSPEGTRNNPAPTKAQTKDDLVIKWRSLLLKSSPTILVGRLRADDSGSTSQQIVGTVGDSTIVILSSRGVLRQRRAYDQSFSTRYKIFATGLFDTSALTPAPLGRPNVMGIGVERSQQSGTAKVQLSGFLADAQANPLKVLPLSDTLDDTFPENQEAGIYPIAAYKPKGDTSIALAIVEQRRFRGGDSIVRNALISYLVGSTNDVILPAKTRWRYPIAPRTYPQPPALFHRMDSTFVGLATASYPYRPDDVVLGQQNQGRTVVSTTSSDFYSLNLIGNDIVPSNKETRQLPSPPTNDTTGEGHSYFVTLSLSPRDSTQVTYRLITENHSPAQPGRARIVLATAGENAPTINQGLYSDPAMVNMGWTIVAADIDGYGPSRGESYLQRNPGLEVVGARRYLDGRDVDTNVLYLFRYEKDSAANRFYLFGRHRFSGRLMAAGHLITGDSDRQEIVTARANTVDILRAYAYTDQAWASGDNPTPFETVKRFTFPDNVVSVVIADLEGDSLNDLIVTTESATYAIGRPLAYPFGAVQSDSVAICQGTPSTVRWTRTVAGGDGGLRISLRGPGGTIPIEGAFHPTTSESYTINTDTLSIGTYRVVIQDNDVPSIVDSTRTIIIGPPNIADFDLPPTPIGGTLRFSAASTCVDSLILERSFDSTNWTWVRGASPDPGSVVWFETVVPCPGVGECGTDTVVKIYYRLVDSSRKLASNVVALQNTLGASTLRMVPADTSRARSRTISWNPTDFDCDSVHIGMDVGGVNRRNWRRAASEGSFQIVVPSAYVGEVVLRVCCDGASSRCAFGKATFEVEPVEAGSYVAPNPFDPKSGSVSEATIVYELPADGVTNVTIYDASRSVVVRLVESRAEEAGLHQIVWDGRNSNHEYVADGTYICVIENGSDSPIILPIVVMKR